MLVEHKSDCRRAMAETAAQLQLYPKGTCPVKGFPEDSGLLSISI